MIRSAEEFVRPRPYPYFVKAAFGRFVGLEMGWISYFSRAISAPAAT